MGRADNLTPPLSRRRGGLAWLAAGALVLVLGSQGGRARADGVVRDSFGPISSGRGGTNLAYSDNLSLVNDNPAGLVRIPGLRLEAGLDFLHTDITYSDPQNSNENAKSEFFFLPNAGLSWQVPGTPVPVAIGFGFFMPAGYGAEYHLNNTVYGNQKYESQAGLFKFLPTISAEIVKGLSVGAGLGAAFSRVDFTTPYTFQTGALQGVPALVSVKTDGWGLAWNIGAQYKITDRWTIGAAYIAETTIDLNGKFKVSVAGSPLAALVPDPDARYDIDVENKWPRSAGVGTTYRFDRGTVALDFLWYDWSGAFKAFDFQLKNGDNPAFDFLAGTTTPRDRFPLEWRDSYTIRLGGEFALTPDDTLRGGYVYITNPIPDRTLTPLIPAILQHAFSVGYGRRFGTVGVDLAYQFSFSPRRTVGTSGIIGGDFDSSSMRAMAHWLFLGVSVNL